MLPSTIALSQTALRQAIAPNPLIVSPDTPLPDAIAQMVAARSFRVEPETSEAFSDAPEIRSSCVLVIEAGQILGIFTEWDVVRLAALGALQGSRPIQDVMTTPVITLPEAAMTDFWTIEQQFQRHQIHHLPIVGDRGQIIGILTRDRLHRQLFSNAERVYHTTENALKIQRDFNQLIAEITSRFIDISPDDLDVEIERTLQLIGEMTQVDTSYLFKRDDGMDTVSMTHEWSRAGCAWQKAIAQNLSLSLFPWANAKLWQREVVNVPSVDELPPEASVDQANWRHFNLRSVLTVPLVQKSTVTGFMGFASFSQTKLWEEEPIRLLQVMGQTIVNAQERSYNAQQLYDSEERLRLALNAANQGLYDLNLQTGDAVVNAEYGLMLGYDPATFQETNAQWIDRLHPDDRERVAQVYRDYVTGRLTEYKVEFRQRMRSGDYKWILSLGRIVAWDENGEPLRMMGTHTDISDRKQAEEQALHRLDILEVARDIIGSADSTGQVIYLNQAGRELLGIAPDEDVSHTRIPDYHPPQIAKLILQEAIPQCIQQGFWEGETRFRRRDGDEFPVWQVIVAHLHANGSISHFSTIARDLRAQQAAQQEREQAAQTRRELNLLENILDTILAGYWDADLVNHEQYISPGFKKMFGYEDDELPNSPETWKQLVFPEDLPKALEGYTRHVQSHGTIPYYNELRYRHKNGSTVWVICTGRVIEWDEEGNPLRLIGCHIDITRQKRVEEQLQETKEELERFFSVTLDLLCIADTDGKFRRLNRSWETTLGYAIADLEGRKFLDFVHPDDLNATLEAIATLAEQTNVLAFVNRYRCKDGSYRYIEWYSRPFGNLIYAAARDITERKQTEERLRRSDAHLRAAQRIGKLGSWEFEVQTGQVSWSDEVFRIFGRNPTLAPPSFEELQQMIHPDDREPHQQAVRSAIATLQTYEIELRVCHPDQSIIYVLGRGEPLIDASGQLAQLVGTVLDITNRKRNEEQIRQSATQLEASNRELEAFAYSVSHDLRAPLRAIDGFSKALLEDYGNQFDEEGRDYFDRIRHNINRMGLLIDDLLRLSRVSRSEMQCSTVNLSALVQEQIQELQATDPDRRVEVVIAPGAIASADPTLMRVVINNLIQNAWKFTSHHPTSRIEFGLIQQDEQPIYFVRDDGAGFDMTYARMLFGVFQRLHNTDEFPGTGIGLATVQRAIHRHGGQIWAESAVEQGATFYFTLGR